jgi:hypothetical protein
LQVYGPYIRSISFSMCYFNFFILFLISYFCKRSRGPRRSLKIEKSRYEKHQKRKDQFL